MTNHDLLALKAERRAIALAVFRECKLYYAQVLHLASNPETAESSALEFVNRNLGRFRIESAVIEDSIGAEETRAAELISALETALQQAGIPIARVSKNVLFESYAVVPLSSRVELRSVISTLWPQLSTGDFHPAVLDAAALGLYAAVEDLLSINRVDP